MLPYAPDAVEALSITVDPAVLKSVDAVGPWHTWVRVEYTERDYPTERMLAVELDARIRKHAACAVTLIEPVLKTTDGWAAYVERMEA